MIPVHLLFSSLSFISTMMNIYMYSCLLSALIGVEMNLLNITGHVGKNVTIKCSNWGTWTNVKYNVKYLCESPCLIDKHIILKAAFGQTNHKKRIKLTNGEDGLSVTFTNIQKSDSQKYYCGVERRGPDPLIEVTLKVTDAESLVTASTLSFGGTNVHYESTMSSNDSMSHTTLYTATPDAAAAQGAGSAPYLIIGVIVITTTILMILLRKQLRVVSTAETPQEDVQEEGEYAEIRPEDQQTVSQPVGVCTLYFSADPDSLYVNYSHHQDTELEAESGNNYSKGVSLNSASSSVVDSLGVQCAESRVTDPLCDLVYSVAQLPEEQIDPAEQSEPHQSKSTENDSLYSLAQLQAT